MCAQRAASKKIREAKTVTREQRYKWPWKMYSFVLQPSLTARKVHGVFEHLQILYTRRCSNLVVEFSVEGNADGLQQEACVPIVGCVGLDGDVAAGDHLGGIAARD